MLKFVTGEPALVFNKNLVIADLHIGIETEYRKSGITVPTQLEKMKGKIDALIEKTKAKRIVFLGDVKHQVPGVSMQELREIPEFFNHFSGKVETHIVLGNHDSEIPALVEGVQIHDTDGFRLEDVYITHGHAWPKKEFLKCRFLVVSHTHPLVEIRDKLGYRFTERIWVKSRFDLKKVSEKYKIKSKNLPEVILMPAFNWLSGGVALNIESGKRRKKTEETFLGPITKLIDKRQTEVFLLDGTYLGELTKITK